MEFLMNYTAIWFLWVEFSKKSWSRQLWLLFQNDTINLHLPKILFNLLLFDDTKGNKTSKSMKFKPIRVTKIIRTTFSNVDNPHQNLTTGFSLRESNHRLKIKLIKNWKCNRENARGLFTRIRILEAKMPTWVYEIPSWWIAYQGRI